MANREKIPVCKCGATHTSSSWCHCMTCHETFGGISGFDKHRVGGRCKHPSDVGLIPSPTKALLTGEPLWIGKVDKGAWNASA